MFYLTIHTDRPLPIESPFRELLGEDRDCRVERAFPLTVGCPDHERALDLLEAARGVDGARRVTLSGRRPRTEHAAVLPDKRSAYRHPGTPSVAAERAAKAARMHATMRVF